MKIIIEMGNCAFRWKLKFSRPFHLWWFQWFIFVGIEKKEHLI